LSLSRHSPALCILDPVDPASGGFEPGFVEELSAGARRRRWRLLDRSMLMEVDETVALAIVCGGSDEGVRRRFPHALIVASANVPGAAPGDEPGAASGAAPAATSRDADLVLPENAGANTAGQLLGFAEANWRRNLRVLDLHREVGARRQRMRQLSDIALSLSSRMDIQDLLQTILSEARRLAGCEAGSLYLLDEEAAEPALVFKLAQNDVVKVPFVETRLPLRPDSVAGYVAISGETLDIPDVYEIPADWPFRFNRSFDEKMGYRTRSMMVLPMRDHRDRVVGVLQFINRIDPTRDEPIPFGDEIGELLRAVASQAAVSIQKNLLISDINRLFEGFVQASVKTIEQRDPTTSGHSFRVAESTVALLEALPRSGVARFGQLQLTPEQVREVRYAALLHDFGKIGVREHVLLKANKLPGDRLEIIRYRIELQKERLRRKAVEQELDLLHHGNLDVEVARRRVHRQLDAELALLDQYFDWISVANLPNQGVAGDPAQLEEIRRYRFSYPNGNLGNLITGDELLALSVQRGSLTPDERREIESHVVHTREFLAVLPWPPELARVPEIAAAHHEKLDGSGYPLGLAGDDIPLPSRVMTVCDIYDALTAMDRPYKPAMSADTALDILYDEARRGLVDADILDVFVASRIYEAATASPERRVRAG
jgi:HD-GYP domain-containing protein (c-di-GMP phosphodiesterase class II)